MQPSWLAQALNVGVVDGLCFGETISDTNVSEKTKFYFLVVFQHWEICTAFLLSKTPYLQLFTVTRSHQCKQ